VKGRATWARSRATSRSRSQCRNTSGTYDRSWSVFFEYR
jgi:hypothetical protein